MSKNKLSFIRIMCLAGILLELLMPNKIVGAVLGFIFATISTIYLLTLKNDIILEESKKVSSGSISVLCIGVIGLLFIIIGYIALKELHIIVLSDLQEARFAEILTLFFVALFGICARNLPYNKYVGLRLPWIVSNPQIWRYAHELLFELTFPIILFCITFLMIFSDKAKSIMIWSVLLYIGVPAFFSYLQYKKICK